MGLFSHISKILLNEISLKKVLNNQSNKNKKSLWDFIQLLYVFIDVIVNDEPDIKYTKKLIEQIETEFKENSNMNEMYPEVLSNLNVNQKTNELVKDVMQIFNENNFDFKNGDPMQMLLNVSNQIENKYGNSLENGEIDIKNLLDELSNANPILKNITKTLNLDKLTKEEQKVVIDENFSTSQVPVGDTQNKEMPNLVEIMKIMEQLKNPDENNPIGKMMLDISKMADDGQEIDSDKKQQINDEMLKMMQQNFGIDPEQIKEMCDNMADLDNQ